jgi:hypothetical protein
MKKIIAIALSVAIVVLVIVATIFPSIESTEKENVLDILIIDGQSNAEYGDTSVCDPIVLNEEYTESPATKVLYYGTATAPANQWDWSTKWGYSWSAFHLHDAYDKTTHKWKIGGYEPILGNTIAEETGHDVLVINMAIGARTIAQLLPDGADGDYSWGVLDHALKQAKRTYDAFNMVGVVWIQGESDKDTPVADYEESFEELMDAFDEYGLDEFYIVKTRDSYGGNSNIAQENIAATHDNVQIATDITETFTQENGMLDANPIHYSQKGRDAISFAIRDKIAIPEYTPSGGTSLTSVLIVIPIALLLAPIYLVAKIISVRRNY